MKLASMRQPRGCRFCVGSVHRLIRQGILPASQLNALRTIAGARGAGALEIQRCRIEEGDRHLAQQLLSMPVEVLFRWHPQYGEEHHPLQLKAR